MNAFRRHFRLHPRAAAWLLAATLLMKLLVPAGFMPVAEAGTIRIELCSGYGPVTASMPMSAAMPMQMPMGEHHGDHDKTQPPCEFSVLGAAGLTDDAVLPIAEPLFFPPLQPAAVEAATQPLSQAHLRPPTRGPPTP